MLALFMFAGGIPVGSYDVPVVKQDHKVLGLCRVYQAPYVELVGPHDTAVFDAFLKRGAESVKNVDLRGHAIMDRSNMGGVEVVTHGSAAHRQGQNQDTCNA